MYNITLMMVTYNRLNLTKKTFDTTMLNVGCNYNLVVVDNCSTDESVVWLKNKILSNKFINKAVIVSLKENKGIAYGRNIGMLKSCECDYLCTIDNDVILPNNWLKRCCNVLENNKIIVACGINLEDINYPKTIVLCKDVNEEIQIKQDRKSVV